MLYGATGFVGQAIAMQAAKRGLPVLLAGRDPAKLSALASSTGLEPRVFGLDDGASLDAALSGVRGVLHCAGPFINTSRRMAEACLRMGVHYLDISGEIPVYSTLADMDGQAKERGVMLLPGVGFDVVPTDCLAVYLSQRLPSATKLTLAFSSHGPARLPPGTAKTLVEMLPFGIQVRRNGRLEKITGENKTRMVDFGRGMRKVTRLGWGDVFMAYYSTGIGNIEDYSAIAEPMAGFLGVSHLFLPILKYPGLRKLLVRMIPAGSTPDERMKTTTSVWGEVEDLQVNKIAARLQGPEAGVVWTAMTALASIEQVLEGEYNIGFQTPAKVFGPDFVLKGQGVVREDL